MTTRARAGAGRRLRRVALLAASLALLSCTANRMHRRVSVEERPDYSLAFIEFDDQGELWAPSQLERALALIESRSRSDAGLALMLFVHGWNDSASEAEEKAKKGTIHQFRELLVRLKRSHRARYPDIDIPVVGVYLAWRGKVSSVPLVRELSFYNRRGAAERIAGSSATEAIYKILTTARANPQARSVVLGHSFGSMILERALAQAVVGALLASQGDRLVFPADLVVLFNPAGSAIQAKQLVDILARNRLKTYRFDEAGRRYERPLLLSFTSESDTATRVFFPVGMSVKAVTKKFRRYGSEYCSPISNQSWLYKHTAGHTPALHSHTVAVGPRRGSGEAEIGSAPPRYESEYDPVTQQMAFSFEGGSHRFTIRRKPRALNDTPYWIMQVPTELIPNHSEIFSAETFALVDAALAMSGAMGDTGTIVEKEDGVRPVAVVPRPDGGALFVDRSRGVYAVRPDSARPVFLSCLTEGVDPSEAVGFQVAGHLAYLALVRREAGSESECRTDIFEYQVENTGYRTLARRRVAGAACYTSAAFDLTEKRVVLGLEDEGRARLDSADMTRDGARPTEWSSLPGPSAPTAMYFEAAGRRLFVTRARSGELWSAGLDDDPPEPRLVWDAPGFLTAMGFGRQRRELYVVDAGNQRIWSLDCEGPCGTPRVFLESESLQNPTTLAVGLDGRVWLGDLEEQTLLTISPEGDVENTIKSLSPGLVSPTPPATGGAAAERPPG